MPLDFPLSTARLRSLRTGAFCVAESPALFRIEGPGALDCLQGLLTSDLAGPGEGSLGYGAILTPRGMIVVDPWVFREGGRFTLLIAAPAREPALALFARVLPPRLARVTDLTGEWTAAWLLGEGTADRTGSVLGALPAPGSVLRPHPDRSLLLAAGTPLTPFGALLVGPAAEVQATVTAYLGAGVEPGDEALLAAARVLTGWPTLGREIDDKTLPQEVRFDELGAVSYVKGCYTGQETVARIHFRGHVNRTLQGVVLEGGQPPADRRLVLAEKEMGSVRTTIVLDDRIIALATLRREVPADARLRAGDREARVVHLPFDPAIAT